VTFHSREPSSGRELLLFTRKTAITVAFAVALALLWAVRDVLILIAIAAVLATGIAPAMQRLQVLGGRFLRRNVPRGTAVLMVYFPLEHNVVRPLSHYIPMGRCESTCCAAGTLLKRRD
jgi:hypothetical protein